MGLLDDITTPSAVVAYGLRKLRTAYSGNCIKVRESGGDTLADIGFDGNGNLDTSALATHCGANDGFVHTFYDQGINGYNLTQSSDNTKQPKIYDGTNGVEVNEHSVPVILFDGINDVLSKTNETAFNNISTLYMSAVIYTPSGYSESNAPFFCKDYLNSWYFNITTTGLTFFNNNSSDSSDTFVGTDETSITGFKGVNTSTKHIYHNGIEVYSGGTYTADTDTRQVDLGGTTQLSSFPNIGISEVILFSGYSDADRVIVEDNQKEYYQDVGTKDTFIGNCDAIYSLRKVKSTYSGSCVRVRRSSDNAETDIGFSGNDIDSTAIGTHCTTSNGYVVSWYDQSGNTYTASVSTDSKEPQIYDGTAQDVLKDANGKTKMQFDGTDDAFDSITTTTFSQANTINIVAKTDDTSNMYFWDSDNGNRNTMFINATEIDMFAGTEYKPFVHTTDKYIYTAVFNGSSSYLYANSVRRGNEKGNAGTQSMANLYIGSRYSSSDYYDGYMQELIIYNGEVSSSDRQALEFDQDGFWVNPSTSIEADMSTININRALPDPTLLLSIELNMDTININRALPDPTATVVPNSVELDMTTINIDRALPDPDVSLSLELDMDTININRALPDPSVSIGINLDMSTLNINRAIPDPTILLSIEINPNEININRALPDPDVTILGGAIDLSMTTININRALPDVDLDIPIVLDMDVININRALPGPTLSLNIRCDMDTLNIDRTLPDTTVLLSIELDMDTINISRSVLNPSVTIGAEVPTGVVNTYKFEFFALNYININIPSKEQYPRVIEFKKNTSEILPITADFFGLLAGIEEIAAIDTKAYLVDSDVTAQIIDSSSFGTYDVDLVVKSGSNGNTYKLTIKITTDDSNIYEEDILMYVRDRVDHEEFTKQPSEQFGVALNLINKLQASETIDTVEFSVLDSSLQTVTLDLIEKYEIDDNLVKFLLKEGIDNETYNININMTTNLGHIYNKNLTLKVVDT